MKPTHYAYDASKVARDLRAYGSPQNRAESIRRHGGYVRKKLVIMPIAKIDVPPIWNEGRAKRVREAMDRGAPLPPVELGKIEGAARWTVGDGIHRTNVSRERGLTHVPAIVEEWIETEATRRKRVPEEPEKLELDVGTWVKLRPAAQRYAGGRVFGWVHGVLGPRKLFGTTRWMYEIAAVGPDDDWPDFLDLSDVEIDPVNAPPWGAQVKLRVASAG